MFTLTAAAAARIRQSAIEGGMADLALRVAARQESDGSITYGMGFDEPGEGERPSLQAEGVTVLIAGSSRPLLQDTELDFVELNPGEFAFIFVPQASAASGAAGCGSCSTAGCGSRGSGC